MFNQFNNVKYVDWQKDTEGFEYHHLSYLEEGAPYKVYGMFITKDRGYGATPVVILENCFVNLPQRYVPIVEEILSRQDCITTILNGGCGIRYEKFVSAKYHREGYGVEFVDI